jgi:hypothetical protein
VLKLAGSKPAAPAETPEPSSESANDASTEAQPSSDDKPFDAEPFNAGVEADEQSDPKKFIEQLTGKLGQSLRKYNEDQGQPDFELEKFAINSLLSATHTAEMEPQDQEDIVKKIKEAGNDQNPKDNEKKSEEPNDSEASGSQGDSVATEFGGGEAAQGEAGGVSESAKLPGIDGEPAICTDLFIEPKKNNMFQPGSNDKLNIAENLNDTEKTSIFDRKLIKLKLKETFNQEEMSEPMIEPMVKPAPSKPAPLKTPNTEPSISPSRKNKPFLPMPDIQPDPKAKM